MSEKAAPTGFWPRAVRSLLFWVIIAIALGALLGQFLPSWAIVPFATFNDIFGKYLSFAVPMIIVGLVTPAIFDIGRSAGKWLLTTALIAYGSTMFAGFGTYFLAKAIYPSLLKGQQVPDLATPENAVASLIDPSFTMPPVFGVMTALILAFVLGIGMSATRAHRMMELFTEFRELIMLVITKSIVPLLPLHIFGIFLNMSKSGQFVDVIVAMGKVILFSFAITAVLLLIQYAIAGSIGKVNPLKSLWGMRDAYVTALGTASSAATIPVTLRCAKKNGVTEEIADFVIPLCATIHLAGSTIKITAFAMALQYMMGITPTFSSMAGFIAMLGIIMVAAPGVPGGAITAAQGTLHSMLGFTDPMYGIMVAMYVAVDSFGTATNVTGDGAIAIVVDKLSAGTLGTEKEATMAAMEDIVESRELQDGPIHSNL